MCFPSLQSEGMRSLCLGGHVGFDSLPDQLVSKSVSQGFCFNILCVGEHSRPCHVMSGSIFQWRPQHFVILAGVKFKVIIWNYFQTQIQISDTLKLLSHFFVCTFNHLADGIQGDIEVWYNIIVIY